MPSAKSRILSQARYRGPSRDTAAVCRKPDASRQCALRKGPLCGFPDDACRPWSFFSVKRFAFLSIRPGVSRKPLLFRLVLAGQRCAASSRLAFFKRKTL